MGKVNTLYNWVKEEFLSLTLDTAISGTPINSDKQKISYYIFPLPNPGNMEIGDESNTFTLSSHHVSIYPYEANKQLKSQYHYTADLKKNGVTYKLHVYYNEKDNQVGLISLRDLQGEPVKMDAKTPLILTELAERNKKALLSELRKKKYETIQKLEEQYTHYEKECSTLSSQQQLDNSQYLAKLSELITITEKLKPLTDHGYYDGAAKFLIKLKSILAAPKKIPEHAGTEKSGSTTTPNPPLPSQTQTTGQSARRRKHHRRKNQQTPNQNPLLAQIGNGVSNLPKTNPLPENLDAAVCAITNLYTTCDNACTTAESLTAQQLKQLCEYKKHIELSGKALFLGLINSNEKDPEKRKQQIQQLSAMKQFYHLINPQHLNIALANDDHLLLDFLLTQEEIFINNQAIDVNNKHYKNAIHYCLENPNTACFSVLLKHNASLMRTNNFGVPAAHIILSIPTHQLHETLTQHLINSSNLGTIYNHLYAAMVYYVKTYPVDEQKQFSKILQEYQFKAELYQPPETEKKWSEVKYKRFNQFLFRFEILKSRYPYPSTIALIRSIQEERKKQIVIFFQHPSHIRFTRINASLTKADISLINEINGGLDKNCEKEINKRLTKVLLDTRDLGEGLETSNFAKTGGFINSPRKKAVNKIRTNFFQNKEELEAIKKGTAFFETFTNCDINAQQAADSMGGLREDIQPTFLTGKNIENNPLKTLLETLAKAFSEEINSAEKPEEENDKKPSL